MSQMPEVAYPRDASWWVYPDSFRPKKLHRVREEDPTWAACSSRIMILTDHPVKNPSLESLCQKCFPHLVSPKLGLRANPGASTS